MGGSEPPVLSHHCRASKTSMPFPTCASPLHPNEPLPPRICPKGISYPAGSKWSPLLAPPRVTGLLPLSTGRTNLFTPGVYSVRGTCRYPVVQRRRHKDVKHQPAGNGGARPSSSRACPLPWAAHQLGLWQGWGSRCRDVHRWCWKQGSSLILNSVQSAATWNRQLITRWLLTP